MKDLLNLIRDLEFLNITYKDSDGELNNVVFEYKGDIYKSCHWFFFRQGGICKTIRTKNKKEVEWIDVTDEMFYEMFKKIILKYFEIENYGND
jgi:hypothetical protein